MNTANIDEITPLHIACSCGNIEIYEDKDIVVVNKPKGMMAHPAAGNYKGTPVNALLWRCGAMSCQI